MSSLDTMIRDHVDALAPPISADEVRNRTPSENANRSRRWPVAVAAAVLAVAGLAAIAVALDNRETPAPADEPEATTLTTTPTTIPPVRSFEIDVPAGSTITQIGELLADSTGTVDPAKFERKADQSAAMSDFAPDGVDSAEGLLAPGAYTIVATDSEIDIAEQMISEMNDLGHAADIEAGGAALGRSAYEILIIASLIESEVTIADDLASVSRVIHNRLSMTAANPGEPMPLQIDAAVFYGRDRLDIDPNLLFSELRSIPSDWNTYLLPGLPLTPITNPSEAAIEAALHPAPNPGPTDPICVDLPEPDNCFILFYAPGDEDGSLNFAATPDQHLTNVERAIDLDLL